MHEAVRKPHKGEKHRALQKIFLPTATGAELKRISLTTASFKFPCRSIFKGFLIKALKFHQRKPALV
jgi:hypothetical protein